MHIYISRLIVIGSDNGLSPDQHQAIIWTIGRILLIRPLGTNSSEISIKIQTFLLKKMHLKIRESVKWQPSCLGFNVLKNVEEDFKKKQFYTWNDDDHVLCRLIFYLTDVFYKHAIIHHTLDCLYKTYWALQDCSI